MKFIDSVFQDVSHSNSLRNHPSYPTCHLMKMLLQLLKAMICMYKTQKLIIARPLQSTGAILCSEIRDVHNAAQYNAGHFTYIAQHGRHIKTELPSKPRASILCKLGCLN
jgi:hypothetical protein